MAVEDLDNLRTALPTLFEDRPIQPDWDDEWVFVPIERPGSPGKEQRQDFEAELAHLVELDDFDEPVLLPRIGNPGDFPGAPAPALPGTPGGSSPLGPSYDPDALAFYLPFHYYHPIWWGIYLTAAGVIRLARHIFLLSGVHPYEAVRTARIFLYGHEYFHHAVESLATRLEVTHRAPVYRGGFTTLFDKQYGTAACMEEALANAAAYRRVQQAERKRPTFGPVLGAVSDIIDASPPGYNRGMDFSKDEPFRRGKADLAEAYQQESMPKIVAVGSEVWGSFGQAYRGIAQVNSRVNYIIPRSSLLAARLRLKGRYLRYREVRKKFRKSGCTEVGPGGNGSHMEWLGKDGQKFWVPRHPGDLNTGTLSAIIKQAGLAMSVSEFKATKF